MYFIIKFDRNFNNITNLMINTN